MGKKSILKCVLFVIAMVFLHGCSNSGTGLSENDRYLSYFEGTESVTGFVLLGEYYHLPTPLSTFLDNGLELAMSAEDISSLIEAQDLNVDQQGDFYLPPRTEQWLDLQSVALGDRRITIILENQTDEEILFFDATVVMLEMGELEKDELVVLGGVTGNTSRQDVQTALADWEFRETGNNSSRHITISQQFENGGELLPGIWWEGLYENISIRLISGTVEHIAITSRNITSEYSEETLAEMAEIEAEREQDRIDREQALVQEREEWFEQASFYEGEVVGIYHITRTDAHLPITLGEIILVRTSIGRYFAVDPRWLEEDMLEKFWENIEIGDHVQVWVKNDDRIIRYDDQFIPEIWPDILIINGEEKHSDVWFDN